MTLKRIKELADFFYSSDSSKDVPLRLYCLCGQYDGFALTKQGFISLLSILVKSSDLKKDLTAFIKKERSDE